ncbi:MAG: single-stranded DNA-binding protein, partial [Deltaproteobacteria bacterium]|nr:single-stranded DNA-binding protein [Deltaproteobacteria bacterium]
MSQLNVVMMMGRLVADPELKYSPSGIPYCRMSLVTARKFTKADGSPGQSTIFVEVDAWRRLAEICAQFLKKGREVFVSGELAQVRSTDKKSRKGGPRIIASTVQFIGAPKESEEE